MGSAWVVRRDGATHIADVGGTELGRQEVVVNNTLLVDHFVYGRHLLVRDGRAGLLALEGGHVERREDVSLRDGDDMTLTIICRESKAREERTIG